jgi:ubiquinone/menaquinone biosynthesis C-methylase UbiE
MPESEYSTTRLTGFYGEMSSLDSIVRALSAEGVDTGRLTARDLYTRDLDCQNLGAFQVLELIAGVVTEYGAPGQGEPLLDVGCGLGGPGRYLAERFGCQVTGIDLLPLRIDTARVLTQMTGLGERITYRAADATALPFKDRTFVQAWMLDASIHMREKAALFGQIARVLRPGGLLVMHDQTAPIPKVMAPVTRRAPYIAPSLPQLIRYVEDAGLRLLTWRDTSALVLEHFRRRKEQRQRMAPPANSGSLKRQARRAASLDAYIEALANHGGRCGILIARRRP